MEGLKVWLTTLLQQAFQDLLDPLSGKGFMVHLVHLYRIKGCLRREKEKDISLHALVAENQAALQLAKQRGDEIQGQRMRLWFQEGGIKRLEADAWKDFC